MRSKSFIAAVLAFPCLVYGSFYFTYMTFPTFFHFRAWELYDSFFYNGWGAPHQVLSESGDSAREFLLQRYISVNNITVNELGNRIACYDPSGAKSPSVLMLGDSQLFGSGLDDADTFPMILCRNYGANIYNGARKHGMNLLRVKEYDFSNIVFTATERNGFKGFCSVLENFRKAADVPLSASDLRIKTSALGFLDNSTRFVVGYLKQRLGVLFRIEQPVSAPSSRLIKYQHKHTVDAEGEDVACAIELRDYFVSRNINVGFMFFPAQQTIYGDQVGLDLDDETLNFIPKVVAQMQAAGLDTFDTKACLMNERDRVDVAQPHDTHLSREGMKALAYCLDDSGLKSLFK